MILLCDALLSLYFTHALADLSYWYNVVHHSDMYFLFLTAQWKAARSGDN